MDKKYLPQIIASDHQGLQTISALLTGGKVKVSDIKYLSKNKVLLLSVERNKVETNEDEKKINSICNFNLISGVKSKNIDQNNSQLVLELIAIDYLKNKDDYEINLIFNNNAHIVLTTEVIDVRLDNFIK